MHLLMSPDLVRMLFPYCRLNQVSKCQDTSLGCREEVCTHLTNPQVRGMATRVGTRCMCSKHVITRRKQARGQFLSGVSRQPTIYMSCSYQPHTFPLTLVTLLISTLAHHNVVQACGFATCVVKGEGTSSVLD